MVWAQRQALAKAFEATTYRAVIDGQAIEVRVHRRCPGLDGRLGSGSGWAWLTAVNPGGRQGDCDDNALRMTRLDALLATLNCRRWPAEAVADAGDWPTEPGFFVVGLNLATARELAGRFGQAAIVWGDGVNPARLEWLASP